MIASRSQLIDDLLHERSLSSEEVWAAAEARLDGPIAQGLNSAHEACDRWARDRARVAIIVRHADGRSERWLFADLARASSRLATAWQKAGLRRGDRVASLASQQIESYIAALAAWRSGLVYVPLFVGFGPDAVSERLIAADVAAVVVDHRFRNTLDAAQSALPTDPHIYTVTGPDGTGLLPGDRSFWSEIDRHTPNMAPVEIGANEPATLMYTSGTTGAPKGCIQPHSALLALQPFVRHTMALSTTDLLFTGANPGWSYGLHTTGAAVMALGLPRVIYTGDFNPKAWLHAIKEEQVTYMASAPTALRGLARAASQQGLSPSVRGATTAGEPLDGGLVTTWQSLAGIDVQDGYGQSESSMLLATLAADERSVVAGALSSPVPGFDVELVDENGVPQAEEGIIAVRNPKYLVSNGYWNAPDLWEARWQGEYFVTGDLGRRDAEGRWWFQGRADDLIVTSGYNVGPTEVESIVQAQAGVTEAAAVAAPDPQKGSVVRVVVVSDGTVPRAQLTTQIQAAVRDRLGRHASPRIVDFVAALPRTETGKVLRKDLRDVNQTVVDQ